jgi:hypothetical protein
MDSTVFLRKNGRTLTISESYGKIAVYGSILGWNISTYSFIPFHKGGCKMDTLKKIFPYSFKAKKDIGALIVNILIQFIIGAVAGVLIGLLSHLPIIGWIIGILGSLVDVYVLVGIVLSVLDYLKLLK